MDLVAFLMFVRAIHNGMGVLPIAQLVCVHPERRGQIKHMHQMQRIVMRNAPMRESAIAQPEIVNVLPDIPATLASEAHVLQIAPDTECAAP